MHMCHFPRNCAWLGFIRELKLLLIKHNFAGVREIVFCRGWRDPSRIFRVSSPVQQENELPASGKARKGWILHPLRKEILKGLPVLDCCLFPKFFHAHHCQPLKLCCFFSIYFKFLSIPKSSLRSSLVHSPFQVCVVSSQISFLTALCCFPDQGEPIPVF